MNPLIVNVRNAKGGFFVYVGRAMHARGLAESPYAKQDRAKHLAQTVTLSEQDLRKLCDMVAENVVKQLAKRYGLRQISIQKTQVGNTCLRKGNS